MKQSFLLLTALLLAPPAALHAADANRVGAAMLPPEIEPVRAPFEMPQPTRPVFPKRTVNIREHGAVGDGKTLCTAAIARRLRRVRKPAAVVFSCRQERG